MFTLWLRKIRTEGEKEARDVLTCLRSSDKGSVALVVLPVNVNIRALGQSDDHVHVAMVARHYKARLKNKYRNV